MTDPSVPVYRIHPGIGIARLGDSPREFCISPEKPAGLPLECDSQGNPRLSPDGLTELTISKFKDEQGRVKRQAARFQIFVYDRESPEGRPLRIGDRVAGGGNHGTLVDIQWRVYLANKKAVWYEFQQLSGERGYGSDHKRRNESVTDPEARQRLIIDPGPRVVDGSSNRRARFSRDGADLYSPVFPPALLPHSIDTLGELLTDNQGRLLVLGGHGRSGSCREGFGNPRIEHYANNDGWFDDVSDGPVMARLVMYSTEVGALRYVDVEYPAWILVGYPRFVPEVLDMVTIDDVIQDMAIRQFAYRTDLFGDKACFDSRPRIDPRDEEALVLWQNGKLEWNTAFKPWFWRDIWPILFRADEMRYLTNVLQQSNYPHDQTGRGNFDPDKLSVPPKLNRAALARLKRVAARENQSGLAFVEGLDPALTLLDDQTAPASKTMSRMMLSAWEGGGEESPREALTTAAAQFAAAVSPDGPGDDPDGYLRHWLRVNEDGSQREAARRFRDAVEAVVGRLLEQASGETPSAKLQLFEVRREDAPSTAEKVSGTTVEEVIERVVEEFLGGKLLQRRYATVRENATTDYFRDNRRYLFVLLRQAGEENDFRLNSKPDTPVFKLPLMPLLAGDNPISNTLPSKFLRLTDYQLFLLRQWANGDFVNELSEGWVSDIDKWQPYKNWSNATARDLDQAVLMNLLGGAFCPGGEVCWVIRNPAIYLEPYRVKADPDFYNFNQTAANANSQAAKLPVQPSDYVSDTTAELSQDGDFSRGLQPGDLTKYGAVPWQADFNECTTQDIDVTFELWNQIDPTSENDPLMKIQRKVWETLWWPAHRPLQTFEVIGVKDGGPVLKYLNWSRGVPQSNAGDLKMVTEWSRLGFVVRNPYVPPDALDQASPGAKYVSVERAEKPKGEEGENQ